MNPNCVAFTTGPEAQRRSSTSARLWTSLACSSAVSSLRLLHHRRDFFEWNGSSWPDADEDMVRRRLYEFLDGHQYFNARSNLLPVKPDPQMVENVLKALRGTGQIDKSIDPPLWLEDWAPSDPFDRPCEPGRRRGIGRLRQRSPASANQKAAAAHAGISSIATPSTSPTTERRRRRSCGSCSWTRCGLGDPQSTATLQEIFGLCLTPDTSYQKIFMVTGPRAAAKAPSIACSKH